MYRIDSIGNVNGRFSDGDATGPEPKPGTVVSADWLNSLQESLCKVIEASGLDLKKNDHTIFLKALEQKILAHIEDQTKSIRDELKKILDILEGKNE